jgi:hypothetical protein
MIINMSTIAIMTLPNVVCACVQVTSTDHTYFVDT